MSAIRRVLTTSALVGSLLIVVAAPATADRPTQGQHRLTFIDVNPCTGEPHSVTITNTFYVHDHDGPAVARATTAMVTSSGFVGRGTSTFVSNGRVEVSRGSDQLVSPSGDRIHAWGVFVLNLATGAVRVERFSIECLGS